jgi:hypothetical protein
MSNSIDALDLPLQFSAVGTVLGMLAALIRQAITGKTDHWQVWVALPSTSLFLAGVLQTVVRAIC